MKKKRKKKKILKGWARLECSHQGYVEKKKEYEFESFLFVDNDSGRRMRSDFKKAKLVIED